MSFWRYEGLRRGERRRQAVLPFAERAARRERQFKRTIVVGTVIILAAAVGLTPAGRLGVRRVIAGGRSLFERAIGLPPDRSIAEAAVASERLRKVEATEEHLARYYKSADPAIRGLFDAAGMEPGRGVVRWGNFDQTFLLSADVFEPDDGGRSYRLKPNTRSVWLRQITLKEGPFALLLIPDTDVAKEAGRTAGGIVVEGSEMTTNSWGLRGSDLDLDADLYGIVLGDSFMMGTFVGDDDVPPVRLERELEQKLDLSVTVVNTGVLGYSPEQYFHSLETFAPRLPRLDFVVVAFFANDIGGGDGTLLRGEGDWDETMYWLGAIQQFCRARNAHCLVTAVPPEEHVTNMRKEGFYPGLLANICRCTTADYLNPTDQFVDENMRLKLDALRGGRPFPHSPLYNGHVGDGHLSPVGCDLWGRIVGERVGLRLALDRANRHP